MLSVIDAQGRLKTVSTRTGPLFIGNLSDPGATLGVAQKDPFNGGDWIFWLRRESSANPCESTFRHQHFSGGASVIPQPILAGISARNTFASPAAIKSDDYLLILDGRGYDGSATDWSEYAVGFSDTAAQIAMRAGSDWSGTNHESYLSVKTVPNAATTPVERFRIESTGFIGHLSGAADPFASFVGHADGADYSMLLSSSNAVSAVTSSGITARRSRGSFASPSATQNGDALFTFQARGYGATGYHSHAAGAINYYASENHSDTAGGGEVHLQTTPNTTVTARDVLTLTQDGLVNLPLGQLSFPATQNPSSGSNVLDDYEEGSWTPSDASGAALSFASASGNYVKIGKLVMAVGNVQYPATADASAAIIGGLPFTSSSGAPEAGCLVGYTNSGLNLYLLVVASTTTISIANNLGAAITNAALTNATIRFVAMYRASA